MIVIFIFLIIWVYSIGISPDGSLLKNKYISNIIIFGVIIFVSITLFFAEINTPDSIIYNSIYSNSSNMNLSKLLENSGMEKGYLIFQWFLSHVTDNSNFLYFGIWIIFSASIILLLKNIFDNWQMLMIVFAYINYSFTINYITNTIRQGLSISLILVAVSLLFNKKTNNTLYILLLILAPFFHKSTIAVSILLFIYNYIIKDRKIINQSWIVSSVFFFTGLNRFLLANFLSAIDEYSMYRSQSLISQYGGVNRIDFYLFSAAIIVYCRFLNSKIHDEKYEKLIDIYQLLNMYFLLFGFVAFSDRIAFYSWVLIPMLVFYPLFKFEYSQVTVPIMLTIFLLFRSQFF